MSFQQTKTLRPNRVRILNLPDTYTKEDINNFAKSYSGFKKADIKKSDDGKLLGLIWFDTPDIAERMAKELDGMTIENIGRINAVLDQPPPNGGKRGTRRGGSAGRPSSSPYDGQAGANGGYWAASGGSPTSQNYYGGGGYVGNNFPIVSSPAFQLALRNHTRGIRFIRMLVPRMHVGLVIGHNGSTIKEITQKSHARIDVRHEFFNRPVHPLRMGNSMVLCQVIFISGHEDECVSAIREMYGLLLKNLEANPNADAGESDSWLWLLAEDRHCGRLIGIAGKHFNAIKEKTNAQVIVGNAPQMVFHQETLEPFFGGPERSVAIRAEGAGEAIKAAGEASQLLLEKLTACRELDIKFASSNVPVDDSYPHSMYAGVLHGASASFAGGQMPRGGGAANGAAMSAMPYTPQVTHSGGSEFEFDHTLYMRIPHTSAGAVIGHDGVTVRKIIADSGAHVFIAKAEDKKNESNGPVTNGNTEDKTRHVTIQGTPEAISKAQFLIFDRVKAVAQQTVRGQAGDEAAVDQNAQPSLTTLIRVPKTMLGRLVGRGGSSIRETQHYSGAFLKLPKHSPKQNGGGADEKQVDTPERDALETVEISGTYIATQKCLDCVRHLLYPSTMSQPPAYPSGGGFRGGASQGYFVGGAGGVEQLNSSLQSLNLMSPVGAYGGSNTMSLMSPGYGSPANPAYQMGGGGMYAQYGYGNYYGQLSFPEYGSANVGPQRYQSGGGPMGKPAHGGRMVGVASGANKKLAKK